MNGFTWFLLGFGAGISLSIWWFRGTMKEWMDKQKRQVKDKL